MTISKQLVRLIIVLALVPILHVKAAPVTIRVFAGFGAGQDARSVLTALVRQWNATHPDIQINIFYFDRTITPADAIQASGVQPDIVGPVSIRAIYETPGLYADLTPLLVDARIDYDPSILKLVQFEKQTIGVPLGLYPSMLWVNEDLFRGAGVMLPPKKIGESYDSATPWDWMTLAKIGKVVTQDNTGHFSTNPAFDPANIKVYGYGDFWMDFRSAMLRFGAANAGLADVNTASFDQPAALHAAQWYHNAIFKDHFVMNTDAESAIQKATPFESGQLAMWYGYSWYLCCMEKAAFKWGVYAPPAVPGTTTTVAPVQAEALAIYRNSPQPEAAAQVLQWLNSADIQAALCGVYGCMPARRAARSGWEKLMKDRFPSFDVRVAYDAATHADSPSHQSWLPNYPQASDAVNNFWRMLRTDPQLDPGRAVQTLNRLEQEIFRAKLPTATPDPTIGPTVPAAATP